MNMTIKPQSLSSLVVNLGSAQAARFLLDKMSCNCLKEQNVEVNI